MYKLFLVSVPIGNLEEITYLAKRLLSETKTIFCEDTRVTKKLLTLLGIFKNQELIKLNEFNEKQCVQEVWKRLIYEDCILVSDAGYPVIADPGYFLISDLRKLGANIQVVNGPCAFIHAIVASGIDSRRIFFANFLTKKYLQRKKEFENFKVFLKDSTVVYYETKNFIIRGLEIMKEVFGDIKIGVGRELSKVNETFYYDFISNIQRDLAVKGEFVVIIPRQDKAVLEEFEDLDSLIKKAREQMDSGEYKLKQICKELSNSKYTSREIYSEYVRRFK